MKRTSRSLRAMTALVGFLPLCYKKHRINYMGCLGAPPASGVCLRGSTGTHSVTGTLLGKGDAQANKTAVSQGPLGAGGPSAPHTHTHTDTTEKQLVHTEDTAFLRGSCDSNQEKDQIRNKEFLPKPT